MFQSGGPTFFELARQALSSTERGYDLLAPKFDRTPFRTPGSLLAASAPYVGPPGGVGRALDLCCGTGAALEMLRPLCRERVLGVDFSLGMLAAARRALAASEGTAEVLLLRADVLSVSFDAAFDVATCFGALGHIVGRDQHRLMATVARALKPGGRFIFPSAEWPRPWSPRLWLSLAFNLGMAARNAVLRPPFVMYYLSFLLPRARRLLAEHGFELEIHRGVDPEHPWVDLVVARKTRGATRISRPRRSVDRTPAPAPRRPPPAAAAGRRSRGAAPYESCAVGTCCA